MRLVCPTLSDEAPYDCMDHERNTDDSDRAWQYRHRSCEEEEAVVVRKYFCN